MVTTARLKLARENIRATQAQQQLQHRARWPVEEEEGRPASLEEGGERYDCASWQVPLRQPRDLKAPPLRPKKAYGAPALRGTAVKLAYGESTVAAVDCCYRPYTSGL
ncbi:hypothetical protein NL676_016724 [Syzygium grande]|nr:hypothetical protein NL676_016724 [Syzygium grande]